MSAKRFNPYKVNGPRTDGHVVRLNPGQEMHVTLDEPGVYGHPGDSNWEIVVKSDFLQATTCEHRSGRKLFRFQQAKDLKRWAGLGTVFLGNVVIYVKDSKMAMEPHASLCVFLSSSSSDKTNQIVVVNPAEEHCVRLEPHQILQVVFPDSKDSSIEWRHHQYPISETGDDSLKMELLRSEVLLKDLPNNRRDVSEVFYTEHLESPAQHHQRHYWFAFDDMAKNVAAASEITEIRPASRIFFIGKDPTGRQALEYSIQVNLSIKPADKHPEPTSDTVSKVHLPMPDEHYRNDEKRILCNPADNEHLNFDSPSADWMVELENPNPNLSNSGWEASVTEVSLPGCQMKLRRLEVTSQVTTSVNGRRFQRFMICPINTSDKVEDKTFLGVVSFKYNGPEPAEKVVFGFYRSCPPTSDHTVVKGLTPPYAASRKSSSSIIQKTTSVTHHPDTYKTWPTANRKPQYPIYTHEPAKKYQTVPAYSEVEIVDHKISTSIMDGEKLIEFGVMLEPKALKKNGIPNHSSQNNTNSNGPRQPVVGVLPPPPSSKSSTSASVVAKKSVVTKYVSEKSIFNPENLAQIPIIGGESKTIRLPITDLCIWSADLGASHDFIVTPIDELFMTPGGQQYQGFKVKYMDGAFRKPGQKAAGVLMLTAKRGATVVDKRSIVLSFASFVKQPIEPLPLGYVAPKTDPIEAASSHIADTASYRAEQSHGLPIIAQEQALRHNRTTLLDPLGGEPKTVEMAPGEELEIILHEPHKTHAHKGFSVDTMMYSGAVEVPDNSIWPLWSNQKVQRVLLKFKGENISGRVFVKSGSVCVGQVEVRPRTEGPCPTHRHDLGIVQWGGLAHDGGYRCLLFRWEDGQTVRLRPTGHMSIALERPSELLLPGIDKGAWHVDVRENALVPAVADLVPTIDRYHPLGINEGFLTPGAQPWESYLYSVRPLHEQQPDLESLTQAFRTVYGNVESFPIGEIIFKYTVPKKFTIQKRLKLELQNNEYYNKLLKERVAIDDLTVTKKFFTVGSHNFTGLVDPRDKSSVILEKPGDCLLLKLPIHRVIEDGVQIAQFWNLHELPAWLTFIGEDDDSDYQLFFFHLDQFIKRQSVCGRIGFLLGAGAMAKRIWVRAYF